VDDEAAAADPVAAGSTANGSAYPTTGAVIDPAGGEHPAAGVEVVAA
jgi:hypothetical protein